MYLTDRFYLDLTIPYDKIHGRSRVGFILYLTYMQRPHVATLKTCFCSIPYDKIHGRPCINSTSLCINMYTAPTSNLREGFESLSKLEGLIEPS